jgi:hypothetical protein
MKCTDSLAGPPTLIIRLPLEGEAEFAIEARSPQDEVRLLLWLRHRLPALAPWIDDELQEAA